MSDEQLQARIKAALRDVPDFPTPGILFKDIAPLLGDAALFADVVRAMAEPWRSLGITHVVGVESRGFILGAAVAVELRAGFVPVRKPGKLPGLVKSVEYALEYGTDRLEMQLDAVPAAARILVIDDVLATGGTASAACLLVERCGGRVAGAGFLLEIATLGGRTRLAGRVLDVLLQ